MIFYHDLTFLLVLSLTSAVLAAPLYNVQANDNGTNASPNGSPSPSVDSSPSCPDDAGMSFNSSCMLVGATGGTPSSGLSSNTTEGVSSSISSTLPLTGPSALPNTTLHILLPRSPIHSQGYLDVPQTGGLQTGEIETPSPPPPPPLPPSSLKLRIPLSSTALPGSSTQQSSPDSSSTTRFKYGTPPPPDPFDITSRSTTPDPDSEVKIAIERPSVPSSPKPQTPHEPQNPPERLPALPDEFAHLSIGE